MEADRAEMKRRLKEVYNYNSYEFAPNEPVSDHISAPYSHEQHRAFLNKFSYYLQSVLAARDGAQATDAGAYTTQIAEKVDETVEMNEDQQRAIQDQYDADVKALDRQADQMLEDLLAFNEAQGAALADARSADEAAAASAADELQKQVIYAMHVLRYAGGRDSGTYGFGQAGSSFYGKGNSLTGIDTLDNFRAPNAHGYAQVSEVGSPIYKLNDDAENRARQEEALLAAKSGFEDMVAACRIEFAQKSFADQDANQAAMDSLVEGINRATQLSN